MNRELIRLLAYLRSESVGDQVLKQLASDIPQEDKLHIALHARYLRGWTTPQKMELVKFFETARTMPGGHSMAGYIDNVSRDFFAEFTDVERTAVLTEGTKWPSSALALLAKLPAELSPEILTQLISLDQQIAGTDAEAARRLEIGIVAVLGRSRDPQAIAYLHDVFQKSPDRRGHIAMAVTQNPGGENWQILVQSLPILEGAFAQQVLITLAKVDQKPDQPEAYRQVILRGLKLKDAGAEHAVKLLEKWTGEKPGSADADIEASLAAWQQWFAATYPNEPEATLPAESSENKWTFTELMAFLATPEGMAGKPELGSAVFAKAQCANCHRHGNRGESIGPDLTSVSQRFQRKEILESILFPSQIISDQYASKMITTHDGRRFSGLVAPQSDGSIIVLQSNSQKVPLTQAEIESTDPSKKSAMPEGLLNQLSLEEVAHLFAYLSQPPEANITQRPTPTSPR
jgi:putative heme-binding domain-containing protein